MRGLLKRGVKFGLVGAVSTVLAYLVLLGLLRVTDYKLAATASWAASVGCGFLLNRRFTFGVVASDGRSREFAMFVVGAIAQYAVAMAAYGLLLGHLKIDPTLAFVMVLLLTTTIGFAYHNLVTFSRRLRARSSGAD
jgi:putative flippase GtrA